MHGPPLLPVVTPSTLVQLGNRHGSVRTGVPISPREKAGWHAVPVAVSCKTRADLTSTKGQPDGED